MSELQHHFKAKFQNPMLLRNFAFVPDLLAFSIYNQHDNYYCHCHQRGYAWLPSFNDYMCCI